MKRFVVSILICASLTLTAVGIASAKRPRQRDWMPRYRKPPRAHLLKMDFERPDVPARRDIAPAAGTACTLSANWDDADYDWIHDRLDQYWTVTCLPGLANQCGWTVFVTLYRGDNPAGLPIWEFSLKGGENCGYYGDLSTWCTGIEANFGSGEYTAVAQMWDVNKRYLAGSVYTWIIP